MGERPALALVEEQEQESHLDALAGEAVSVAAAIALEQAVALERSAAGAEAGKAIRDGLDFAGRRREGELFVLFEKGVLPVRAEDGKAVLDLIDNDGEFPVQPLVQTDAKNLAAAVGGVVGRVGFKDEVPAVLDCAKE
jgi:hypothetical protein